MSLVGRVTFRAGLDFDVAGGLERWFRGVVAVALKRARARIRAEVPSTVPIDTGFLRESMNVRLDVLAGVIELEWTAPYAGVVERGAVAHTIVPKRKKVLSWVDKATGKRVFARRVKHPGFRGRRFRVVALAMARDIVMEEIRQAISEKKVVAG